MQMKKIPQNIVFVATIASHLSVSRNFCEFYAFHKPKMAFLSVNTFKKGNLSKFLQIEKSL